MYKARQMTAVCFVDFNKLLMTSTCILVILVLFVYCFFVCCNMTYLCTVTGVKSLNHCVCTLLLHSHKQDTVGSSKEASSRQGVPRLETEGS